MLISNDGPCRKVQCRHCHNTGILHSYDAGSLRQPHGHACHLHVQDAAQAALRWTRCCLKATTQSGDAYGERRGGMAGTTAAASRWAWTIAPGCWLGNRATASRGPHSIGSASAPPGSTATASRSTSTTSPTRPCPDPSTAHGSPAPRTDRPQNRTRRRVRNTCRTARKTYTLMCTKKVSYGTYFVHAGGVDEGARGLGSRMQGGRQGNDGARLKLSCRRPARRHACLSGCPTCCRVAGRSGRRAGHPRRRPAV